MKKMKLNKRKLGKWRKMVNRLDRLIEHSKSTVANYIRRNKILWWLFYLSGPLTFCNVDMGNNEQNDYAPVFGYMSKHNTTRKYMPSLCSIDFLVLMDSLKQSEISMMNRIMTDRYLADIYEMDIDEIDLPSELTNRTVDPGVIDVINTYTLSSFKSRIGTDDHAEDSANAMLCDMWKKTRSI